MYKCTKTGSILSLEEILSTGYDAIHINKTCTYVELWKGSEYYKYTSVY